MRIMRRLPMDRFYNQRAILPFPDETVGSIAARYHLWSCNVRTRRSLVDLFGCAGMAPNSALPTRLADFSRQVIGSGAELDVDKVIASNTLLPYYSFFWTREHVRRVASCMAGVSYPKASAGLLASTFGASDTLRYCPECQTEDTVLFGLPYWHRRHQLPEVVVCCIHCFPLIATSHSSDMRGRHALTLPLIDIGSSSCAVVSTSVRRRQVRFANSSADLLDIGSGGVSPKKLLEAYKDRLIARGLAKKSGRIDRIALRNELTAHHSEFDFLPRGDRLLASLKGESTWLERIVRKPRTRQHPVLHLILLSFLFDGPKDLVAYMETHQLTKPTPNLNPRHVDETLVTECLVKRSLSLRAAGRELGISVDSLRTLAKLFSINISIRPKYISPELESAVVESLAAGTSVPCAAVAHAISTVSVYRILRSRPGLRSEIDARSFNLEVQRRRSRFLKLCHQRPEVSYNARKADPSGYAWLARHDRTWLTETLRNRILPPAPARARVDWSNRDRRMLLALQLQLAILRSETAKPVRVTVSELGRRTGTTATLQKKLCNLPLTSDFLREAIETTRDFQIRRVDWAIKCSAAGWTRSTIARIAGINDLGLVGERLIHRQHL